MDPPGLLGEGNKLRIAGSIVGPEHGFDIGLLHVAQVCIRRVQVVAVQRFDNGRVLRSFAPGHARPEKNVVRPTLALSRDFEESGPEIAVGLRMAEGKPYELMGLVDQRLLLEQQTATHRPVTPVGSLLPWPPEGLGIGGILGPRDPLKRGKERFQISRNAVRLFLQLHPEPSLRQNASKKATRERPRLNGGGWL